MSRDDDRQTGDHTGQFRQGAGWLLLAAALGGLGTGIALGEALPLAGGLVLAGVSGNLLTASRRPTRPE
ncbi:hypothetical protein [Streptomyces natalensis]|uniref:Uncharacterized protein n=1 Tax=Streptomyces natalensis ATCC 27448 TaxID=1240678 RepID=A0A0D7CLI2_9ACTN|nr:hypothetical protein [Streptomyces natalensis]KIZ16302.1 hypothetical protein SNA_24275 [Streptomyces natalensis ATCC 27448]